MEKRRAACLTIVGFAVCFVGLGGFLASWLKSSQEVISRYGYPTTIMGWVSHIGLWMFMVGVLVVVAGLLWRLVRGRW